MNLPDSVKIGHMRATVTQDASLPHYGLSDYGKAEITLQAGIDGCLQFETLFHEIAHFAAWNAGIKLTPKNHQHIDVIMSGLLQALQDNPQLTYCLAEHVVRVNQKENP
jgi:hypothetical protein